MLVIISGELLCFAIHFLSEIIVVVAVVAVQVSIGDFDDAVADAVEEFTVVRDGQNCARVVAQLILKPAQCLEVQVIGRLIEHQQIRLHD